MKQYTHAWVAFKAVERLKDAADQLDGDNKAAAEDLFNWIMHHEDDIIQGAWYPDAVIKDMANSHVLKITASDNATNKFKKLPTTYLIYKHTQNSELKSKSFEIDESDNLPDRCESITHSIVDNAKMQSWEDKGSPVAPTSNHIAMRFFMLSHYIADAHVPFHCDSRQFSEGDNIHAKMEKKWDDLIKRHYEIDKKHKRFLYDPYGFPLRTVSRDTEYQGCYLRRIEQELERRRFQISFGTKRDKTWDFMSAVCQYSYLLSHLFIPSRYNHRNVDSNNWISLGSISFDDLSVAVLSDAIDSVARVWFRAWRKYLNWAKRRGG
jgi:hypothetical protein